MHWQSLDISIDGLQRHYQNGEFTPAELIEYLQSQIDTSNNPAWIHRLTAQEIAPYLAALPTVWDESLPLYGVPFAIKDNIDLANIPTTAACPEFSYTPNEHATVVALLIKAGAIPLGKTNMDQFATGLVGVRSPYGACHNVFEESAISGGSSSGSAVAVASHWVSFSLGTDTAGSGRVPASLNHIVGLKPSRGLISMQGVVPACRSLDCVSIFALNTDDANRIFDVVNQFDGQDCYARQSPFSNRTRYYRAHSGSLKLGVPDKASLEFFGDKDAEALFDQCIISLTQQGVECVPLDFKPFVQAAKLLYEGPWVTERYIATQSLLEQNPEAALPVIRTIIEGGKCLTAQAAFESNYRLQGFAQQAQTALDQVDAMLTPTHGTWYTIDAVQKDPIALNSNLGYYTNFMNLLDYSALAFPFAEFPNGVGFGVTLFANAMQDKRLLSLGARLQNLWQVTAGKAHAYSVQGEALQTLPPANTVDVVVCGAHLSGMPLNWQLTERGGQRVSVTRTSPLYQLYALPGGPPQRPGLARVASGGVAIDVEVWRLPTETFGSFVAEIPKPLGVGKVELAKGDWVSGFICEPYALDGAKNISDFGGWRAYMQSEAS